MRSWIRIAVIALVLLPVRAFAWGEEGHRTVCAIAWQRLTPAGHSMMAKVLGTDDEKAFAEACLWADQIKRDRPETSAYHYINIPAGVSGMSWARDCSDTTKRCVSWAIEHYALILADPNAKDDQKLEALKFVGHFVGDLHQPLHAGRPDDLGGNKVLVDWFGNSGNAQYAMNLHSVWDTQIIKRTGVKSLQLAQFLNAQVVEDEAAKWQTLDVVGWTNDSYQVCEQFVYPRVPADGKLRNGYYAPAAGYTALQLQKAGVRLAYLLNAVAAGTLKFPDSIS